MSEYTVSEVFQSDARGMASVHALLGQEGIQSDPNIEYTAAVYDQDGEIIATGSTFSNTLRCLAVSGTHRGEGLMNLLVSHLIERLNEQGQFHIFLYTKWSNRDIFSDLGFATIAGIKDLIIFMENKRSGFVDYLHSLKHGQGRQAAIVMNANPFTNGHLHLVEKASRENDSLHLFLVAEDCSLVPFSVRARLVCEGTAHLENVIYHTTGSYLISSANFPSYFIRAEDSVTKVQAALDIEVFAKIADHINISVRYVGEEPKSVITGMYNEVMKELLPTHGIRCIEIPRVLAEDEVISASTVRKLIHDGKIEQIKPFVPQTTYAYFMSDDAKPVIEAIVSSDAVIHE